MAQASDDRHRHPHPRLVGIGASAGGIPALRAFFADVPADSGIAFAVVIHLSPDHPSSLAEVLQPACRCPVIQVRDRVMVQPDHVYVIPPNRSLEAVDGYLDVTAFAGPDDRRSPIDAFFQTLAAAQGDAAAVLLSGSGRDGILGMRAIKEAGGLLLVQDPEEASHDSMPRGAVESGLVDFVLPARELGARVVEVLADGSAWQPPAAAELTDDEAVHLQRILSLLRARTGHDFASYKKSTVLRRVGRRMQVSRVESLADYLDHLTATPGEARHLMKDLLISVTRFFRDPEAFRALDEKVIEPLFGGRGETRPVRVWVPGCATGEEAYSLAMLLHERASALPLPPRIQVFATDLDEEAVAFAREGVYLDAVAADVCAERIARFFIEEGPYLRVRKELRECILFSVHSLLKDPPFSRLDLVSARNLLIYLEPELQDRVMGVVHYALEDGGHLFLGSSESADPRHGFQAVDGKHRIYRSVPRGEGERLPDLPLSVGGQVATLPGSRPGAGRRGAARALHVEALEAHAPPSVAVDLDQGILHVSESASRYLDFPPGAPTANLFQVVRPELRIELRAALGRAVRNGEPTLSAPVSMAVAGEPHRVTLYVSCTGPPSDPSGALVLFLDSAADGDVSPSESGDPGSAGEASAGEASEAGEGSEAGEAGMEAGEDVRRLRISEAELDVARERLNDLIEASEGREEDLQAANEELQSINEEYRSTLEELETSKEELQSMNEELRTVNDELGEKVEALFRANDDLRNLMAATEVATLFLDADLHIKRFTPALTGIFNVLAVDEGRPLHHLTHALDYPELGDDCRDVLSSRHAVERDVAGREGRHYLARLAPYRTDEDRVGGVVATFTDITRVRKAQQGLRRSEARFRALVDASAEVVWTTDPTGSVASESVSWEAFTGARPWTDEGGTWLDSVHPDDRAATAAAMAGAMETGTDMSAECRLWHAPSGAWRDAAVRIVPVSDGDGSVREWVGMSTDITERKEAENAMARAQADAVRAGEAKSQFLSTLSHELRTPLNAVIGLSELMTSEIVGPVNDVQRDYLERIKAGAWYQLSMIEEILSFTRAEAGKAPVSLRETDVAAVAREVIDMVEALAGKAGLELRRTGLDRPVPVVTDPGKVRQILTNLVGNAVKFTDRGFVELALEASDGGGLTFRVRDTGPGIPPGHRQDIFDPFVQVDPSTTREQGGTGLGLALSRRLARLLGGDIEVESEEGEGSVFVLRIAPAADGDGDGDSPASRDGDGRPDGR